MRIFLVRHGETDWNKRNLVLGRSNVPLNDTGRKQAEDIAKQLSVIRLHRIYTSPLSRAKETAAIIRTFQVPKCRCTVSNCLIEQDFGIFEGVSRCLPEYKTEKRKFYKRYKNGESYSDVVGRVYPFIKRVLKQQQSDVLLVTHGGICRIIANYFQDMENEDFASFKLGNCEMMTFEF